MFLPDSKKLHKTQPINITCGFSLVEVMVSMSIFTMVVGIAVGSLIVMMDAYGKAQSTQAAVSNVMFTLDRMSREIRTGSYYFADTTSDSLPTGGNDKRTNDCSTSARTKCIAFSFIEAGSSLTKDCKGSAASGRIAYRYNQTDKSIERRLCNIGGWQPISAPDVVVEDMYFEVRDTASLRNGNSNLDSPLVTIFIKARAGKVVSTESVFSIQSSVTQQVLDI